MKSRVTHRPAYNGELSKACYVKYHKTKSEALHQPIFLLVNHSGQQLRGLVREPDVRVGMEETAHEVLRWHEPLVILVDAGVL